MVRTWILVLFLLTTMQALASNHYAILSPTAEVLPHRGNIILTHNGVRSLVKGACSVVEGDWLYLPKLSRAVVVFPDGYAQAIDGEASIEVSPLFHTKPLFSWNLLKRLLASIF